MIGTDSQSVGLHRANRHTSTACSVDVVPDGDRPRIGVSARPTASTKLRRQAWRRSRVEVPARTVQSSRSCSAPAVRTVKVIYPIPVINPVAPLRCRRGPHLPYLIHRSSNPILC